MTTRRANAALTLGPLALLGLAGLLAPAARAATFTVTNTNDSEAGSLRAALAAAADGDAIQIAATGTVLLAKASGPLAVPHAVTIAGPGPAALALDGGGAVRVLAVTTQTFPPSRLPGSVPVAAITPSVPEPGAPVLLALGLLAARRRCCHTG